MPFERNDTAYREWLEAAPRRIRSQLRHRPARSRVPDPALGRESRAIATGSVAEKTFRPPDAPPLRASCQHDLLIHDKAFACCVVVEIT
jgi:hypothetical protein